MTPREFAAAFVKRKFGEFEGGGISLTHDRLRDLISMAMKDWQSQLVDAAIARAEKRGGEDE